MDVRFLGKFSAFLVEVDDRKWTSMLEQNVVRVFCVNGDESIGGTCGT